MGGTVVMVTVSERWVHEAVCWLFLRQEKCLRATLNLLMLKVRDLSPGGSSGGVLWSDEMKEIKSLDSSYDFKAEQVSRQQAPWWKWATGERDEQALDHTDLLSVLIISNRWMLQDVCDPEPRLWLRNHAHTLVEGNSGTVSKIQIWP